MKWFEGDIAEAIALTKQRNAIFVVFVYGNDETSTSITNAINSSEVSQKLSSNDFVAIKLESGSQPYHQFVQIYQLVPVPSLFFIGNNGVPLDVVPGQISSSDLLAHINKIQEGPSQEKAAAKENTPPPVTIAAPVATNADQSSSSSSTSAAAEVHTETLEERIQRAEKARAAIAAKKQKEEERKEREREILRRSEGQKIAQAQREREALEAQQAAEERRKDKELEKAARERVLQQIAQDKRERAARFATESSTPSPAVTTPTPTPSISTATSARLQFRLPDGSSHTHVFEPDDLLGEVRRYVRSTLHPGSFILSMAFPRSELTISDDSRTLQDLGLVPSAALLILPTSSGSGVVASSGGVMALIWLLLSPFAFIWTFVSSRIWGAPGDPPRNSQGPSAAAAAAESRANQGGVRQRVKREGNIHRLAGSQDPDDENNTYNGNSTQQM